jgi:hypothetical protein
LFVIVKAPKKFGADFTRAVLSLSPGQFSGQPVALAIRLSDLAPRRLRVRAVKHRYCHVRTAFNARRAAHNFVIRPS